MGFQGYKLKHKLIVFQSFQDSIDPFSVYAQTFEIILFISSAKTKFLRFDEIETTIAQTLGKYSEKSLVKVSPFDQLEPTLENMGNVFYQLLRQGFAKVGISLERLEISESPVRTFVVNESNMDTRFLIGDRQVKLNSLLVGNMISQSVSHLISEFEEQEQDSVSVVHSPKPPEEAEQPVSIIEVKKMEIGIPMLPQIAPAYQFVLSVLFLIACGALISLYLKNTGAYPSGADIYGHLFKSDLLYHSMKGGDRYPLYTDLWYNGIQPFRYWAPLPYYLLAVLQFFAGGDAVSAYLLFVCFSFVAGGIGWLLWGLTYNRMVFCTFLGALWFFLPDNIRVFFVEGNLPRMVIAVVLPYLFYFIWKFVEHRRKGSIIPVVVIMCAITLCHAMIAAMTGIATFLFLLIYSVRQRRVTESFYLICSMLLSFALCGFWLYPALKGGLLGMEASSTAEVMQALSTPVLVSLNPFLRNAGMYELFYFGVSILALAILGLFLANRKSLPGFYTVAAIFIGTTTAMVPFLEKLPLNQLFWMTRFTPIAYTIFLLSLLEWKNCRRYAVILIALIIVLDCIPSVDLQRYHSQTPAILSNTLSAAKDIVKQRVSLLDVSAYGSYPSFHLSAEDPKTQYTFGWAWQGAATAKNIVMINTALENGYYYYLFDRSLELGDDTILVRKELVTQAKKSLTDLKKAALASGYTLYGETNYTYIFHCSTPKTFGTITDYSGLAIGRSARSIALEYPNFEEGDSQNLTDYSFKELSKYKVIYLSVFSYSNREIAEALLTRVANAGVKIIIDMNQIPVDPITSRMTFFDVTAQTITFSERYPELIYRNRIYEAAPFKKEYSTWNTVYLENLEQIIGYSWFERKELPFLGTAGNENIIFMGYNFLFHGMETNDQPVIGLMSELIEMEPNQLPSRKIVPLKIEQQEDKIVIDSPGGEVNTTLAYQDNFRSKQKITNQNNLLTVSELHTEINLVYPYFIQGFTLSCLGLLGIGILLYVIYRRRGVKFEKEIS